MPDAPSKNITSNLRNDTYRTLNHQARQRGDQVRNEVPVTLDTTLVTATDATSMRREPEGTIGIGTQLDTTDALRSIYNGPGDAV